MGGKSKVSGAEPDFPWGLEKGRVVCLKGGRKWKQARESVRGRDSAWEGEIGFGEGGKKRKGVKGLLALQGDERPADREEG